MRFIKLVILAVVAIALIFVALANGQMVELNLVPGALVSLVGFNLSVSLPLFVVIFGGVAIGMLVGYIAEWLREHKHRRAVRQEHKQVVKLER
ncbi:MAG: LapA family protein, partial [Pseudomonadota bacterium]